MLELILSSVMAGTVATAVMVVFLYLPLLWGGMYYDTLGAIGGIFLRPIEGRSRLLGGLILLVGGVLFALFYGSFVLMFMRGPFPAPDYTVLRGWPVQVNLFYPLFGLVGGLGQGIFMSLITTFIVTDFYPVESYRNELTLILSYIIGHVIYGVTVMFFQSQFLQLLLGGMSA